MSSSVQTKFFNILILLSFIFPIFFVAPVFADTPLNLTGDYSNNPSTNPSHDDGTHGGFQLVPDCTSRTIAIPGQSGQPSQTQTVMTNWNQGECGWVELLQLVRNIMSLMLFLSASIAVISFTYAGFLYLTSFGDMGKVEQAHGIFSKVMIGFCFVFLGWLIVATILKIVGLQGAFTIIDFSSVTGF